MYRTPCKNMAKKGKSNAISKEEVKLAEALAKAAKLPAGKPKQKARNHRHPVLGSIPQLSDVHLLPSSMEASATLLQPDALLARGGGTAGNRFPGGGDPTATLVTRAYAAVTIGAATQEMWYWIGMHTQLKVIHQDEIGPGSTVAPHTVFGSVLRLTVPTADTGILWPAFATLYKQNVGSEFVDHYVVVLPWDHDSTTCTFSAFIYTDGLEIWGNINAVDTTTGAALTSDQGALPRMKLRKTGGDLLFEAAPTLETSCIVAAMTTQTGASGIGHSPLTTAGLRAASRTYDYSVVNVEKPGFNARWSGPVAVNNLYDGFNANQEFEDGDEDDVTTALMERRLEKFKGEFITFLKSCTTSLGALVLRDPPASLRDTQMGPSDTDSPPDIPDTVTCVYVHNSGPAFDGAVTAAFSYEFTPPIGGGYETKAVLPDPNWAVVLDVSHTKVPILVGPHSFGDFFSSLWSGIKDVASEAWSTTKDIAKAAATGAGAALIHG